MIDWIKERIEDAKTALCNSENQTDYAYAEGRLYELRDILDALESQK